MLAPSVPSRVADASCQPSDSSIRSGGCCGGAKVANDPAQASSNETTRSVEAMVRRRVDIALSSRSLLIENRSLDS
jgi:hypothetical protein